VNEAQRTIAMTIKPELQIEVLRQCRDVIRQAPLVRPTAVGGKPMRVRVTSAGQLGWVGDGAYRYTRTQANGKPWPSIPLLWAQIADDACGRKLEWDSAIVNWYEPGASLGWHVDRSEKRQHFPIVTISIGDAAAWAVRLGRDAPIHRTRLESGDVTVLAGPWRRCAHTIERIIAAPLLSPLRGTRGRVSITLRVAG